ncbi:hypothetical protein [Chitinophaga pinensis]|uniref:Uncharacterized protein n=1 Tax=Chitinophaga pinensis (strain ATCC 43595 / DSM 2588 / LMG 13176 / NBRC 15968 / NCIMB 11800 / UQM 2034) TaxID=485918 RepID=A0A979GSX5_CHIPD|nr:hypothetical protein [Chitinophaga pinensis]ACU59704.1 conserved hypothetical protein [Chitinophaga pinensis DSM 2588]
MKNINELLSRVLEAHGGMERWNALQHIKAHVQIGGLTWTIKGHEGILSDIVFSGALHEQKASWASIYAPGWTSAFDANRVALLDAEGKLVEELHNPSASFAGHTIETPWSRMQLIYFCSYATWNYLTTPFNFTLHGYQVNEIEPWQEEKETWRRLEVIFPDTIATHSKKQLFYFDQDFHLRRHDYWPEVLGGAAATQIISGYKDFSGIKTGTERRIYILNDADNSYQTEPVLVSIDVLDIQFS